MFLSRYNSLRSVSKELDDPLLFYEHSLAQHVQMNDSIYELLEIAVLDYKDDYRYKNSSRYLRLWLMYILYLNTPQFILPILCGLVDNHIGDKLATLYEAIAYYQFKADKLKEVEATLLLGLKNNAQPIKSLERVLYQFHKENTITFNTNHFSLSQFNIDYNHSLKYPTLKSQLDWIDAKLQHVVRAGILRECCRTEIISFEELRARSLTHHQTTDGRFNDIKKDIENVHNTIKGLLSRVITPSKDDKEAEQTILRVEQIISLKTLSKELEPVIPTVTEQETANVVQLPHNDGFIQNQIISHEVDKHDDYHTYDTNAHTNNYGIIQLGDNEYHMVKKIGQGGMAHVYLVQNTNTLSFYGLKVQQPPHPWEFYILYQMYKRKKQQKNRLRVLPVYEFHQYIDKSYFIMPHIQHGTLLDALNLYRNNQPSMPEPIVLLFTLQLLQQVIALHNIHISHNDLKLDNIMLVKRRTEKLKLPALVMIDFGRSIDLTLFNNAIYKADWPPVCALSDYPLLNKGYYPIHADYWQLATMVHLLLFSVPMKYIYKNNRYSIQNTIRRYWNKSLWVTFFETLLNPQEANLQELIQEFEKKSYDVPEKLILDFKSLLPIGSENL